MSEVNGFTRTEYHYLEEWFANFFGHGILKKQLGFCGTALPSYIFIYHYEPTMKLLLARLPKLLAKYD